MKQNIIQKLREIGLSEAQSSEIMLHIFGGKSGPTFFEGLVDTENEAIFDEKLSQLRSAASEGSENSITDFYSWFAKYHKNEIKTTMLKPIRRAAGLGDPPAEFCTNDSEAINSTLKQFLNFKKSDCATFRSKNKRVCQRAAG